MILKADVSTEEITKMLKKELHPYDDDNTEESDTQSCSVNDIANILRAQGVI